MPASPKSASPKSASLKSAPPVAAPADTPPADGPPAGSCGHEGDVLSVPLGFLLLDAHRLIRARFDARAEAAGLGLTAGEARALLHISKREGRRQNVLAEHLNIDPMTLVTYLDRLEAAGLVQRCPDPADRRAKVVRLTPASAPVLTKVQAVCRAVRADATAGLTEEDVRRLAALIGGVIGALSGLAPPA